MTSSAPKDALAFHMATAAKATRGGRDTYGDHRFRVERAFLGDLKLPIRPALLHCEVLRKQV